MTHNVSANMPSLECHRLSIKWQSPLVDFFDALRAAGDDEYFHPHPLNNDEACRLSSYHGNDLYYVLTEGENILGYGILRGWDEGYEVPSLGIVLHPTARGKKLSVAFMHFLHAAARLHGAARVRLKVYPNNLPAIRLYEKLGYAFKDTEAGQLVGFLDIV